MANHDMGGETEVEVRCPHCGSHEIVGRDTIQATAPISGWKRQADGALEPEWAGSSDVDWDSQQPVDSDRPYACNVCDEYLSAAELKADDEGENEGATMIDQRQYGMLAQAAGRQLELQTLSSGAGFYLGTYDDGPFTRESAQYFATKAEADAALATGSWTQRIEN